MWLQGSSRRALLLLHFAGMLFPSTLIINLFYAVLLLFIPVMGRAGTASYPELFIGCVTVSAVIVLSAWQVIMVVLIIYGLYVWFMCEANFREIVYFRIKSFQCILIIYTVLQKNGAKIQITITTAYLIRIEYPLSGFSYHLSDVNVANFNKIHCTVSEQQLF